VSNTITFHGRLTKDAWTGATKDGKAMARFTVAEDVGYGDKKHTNFHDVALFGKRAEGGLVQYLVKGQAVFIAGEIKIEQPREHGGKHYNNITVFPQTVDLIGGRTQSGSDRTQGGSGSPRQGDGTKEFDDSDIPFVTRDGVK
jgi:single-strand DNA-binding protein